MATKHTAWTAQQTVRFVEQLRAKIVALVGDEDADIIRDTIEGEVELEPVASALLKAHNEAKAAANGLAAYIEELTERKKTFEARADKYRDLLFQGLTAAEQSQVKTVYGTATIMAGRDRTVVHDETILPAWFFKSVVDTSAVKEALVAGQPVPGAAIEKGPPSLQIRTK